MWNRIMQKRIFYCIVFINIPCFIFPKVKTRGVDLTIKTHRGAGFFAELTKVVASIMHYEQEGFSRIYVDWTDEFFPYKNDPQENGWDVYFEPICLNNRRNPARAVQGEGFHELHDQICNAQWISYEQYLPYRMHVSEIIQKYIHIKKCIRRQAEDFFKKNMRNALLIGVQVRFAQTHAQEVPGGKAPKLSEYCQKIEEILRKNQHRNIKIYIASDSNYAMSYFKKKYKEKVICIDAFRASGAEDPHLIYENPFYWTKHPKEWHQKKPGFYGGLTVLLDCLLLAKCDYFIHTTSNVATFVSFFNPKIKSLYLPINAPYISCRFKNDPSIKNKRLNPI